MNKILTPLMSMAVLLLLVSDTGSVLPLGFPVTYRVRNHIRAILTIKIRIAKHRFDAILKDKMLNCFNPFWRSKPKFSSCRSFTWSVLQMSIWPCPFKYFHLQKSSGHLQSREQGLSLPSSYWNLEGMKSSSPPLNN